MSISLNSYFYQEKILSLPHSTFKEGEETWNIFYIKTCIIFCNFLSLLNISEATEYYFS